MGDQHQSEARCGRVTRDVRARLRIAVCATAAGAALSCTATTDHSGTRSAGLPGGSLLHGAGGSAPIAPIAPNDAGTRPQHTASGSGSGGAAPAPIGGADAGTFTPRPELDPKIMFDWKETTPGGSCQAGTYTGTFECVYNLDQDSGLLPPDAGTITVSGPITLHFSKSADGEFLELTDAELDGVAMDFIGFTTKLTGRLDCTTLQFTSTAQDGEYGLGLPIGIPLGTIDGTLDGMLDAQTGELSGVWMLGGGTGGTCNGPWKATFTP